MGLLPVAANACRYALRTVALGALAMLLCCGARATSTPPSPARPVHALVAQRLGGWPAPASAGGGISCVAEFALTTGDTPHVTGWCRCWPPTAELDRLTKTIALDENDTIALLAAATQSRIFDDEASCDQPYPDAASLEVTVTSAGESKSRCLPADVDVDSPQAALTANINRLGAGVVPVCSLEEQ